jgi:hypothetical protein
MRQGIVGTDCIGNAADRNDPRFEHTVQKQRRRVDNSPACIGPGRQKRDDGEQADDWSQHGKLLPNILPA